MDWTCHGEPCGEGRRHPSASAQLGLPRRPPAVALPKEEWATDAQSRLDSTGSLESLSPRLLNNVAVVTSHSVVY